MIARRSRIYDALALLSIIVIIGLDQWTKALVVEHLSPPESKPRIPLVGQYLTLFYVQNRGAAFGLFANSVVLVVLIAFAIGVISYLYFRILNSGSLAYKLIFSMIIAGAAGNLIDRAQHGGYVVDFIFFRVPEIGYKFAIFNVADASISVGVFLLFVLMIFGSFRRSGTNTRKGNKEEKPLTSATTDSGTFRPTE